MGEVLDLRGRQLVRDCAPVLLDPSGGRARALAWVGRAVGVVFLLWLIGLVFAGLGLLPSGDLPLGRAFVGESPPALKALPRITQPKFAGPTAGGSRAGGSGVAVPASSIAAGVAAESGAGSAVLYAGGSVGTRAGVGAPSRAGRGHFRTTGAVGGGSSPAGGSATGTPVPASHPNNGLHAAGTGPGRTISQSSPGHTNSSGTGFPAGSGRSSGNGYRTTTTTTPTTAPGKSGYANGHAAAR